MKCPECRIENPDDAKFCIECASPMEFRCPNCGAITPAKGKFCKECAFELRKPKESPPINYSEPQSYTPKFLADKILTTRSTVEGEKKHVTVLFADVANYTSIAEKLDPEDVHQMMDGCFRILMDEIHGHEGTINQFTGDGVMAIFGAPVAHEDHAQRACHAALSIQKALKRYSEELKGRFRLDFKMRIGLNSGPVVVGAIGDDLRMDYTAVGDTTNLAARIENMADPGKVLVSAHTHKLSRDYFQFDPIGEVEIKGKEQFQEAYELIEATEVETRIEAAAAKGLTKFVGRGVEMEALTAALEKARNGSGQVVGIVGEAGVGKSRLLLELRNLLPGGECSYYEGRCLHFGGSMAYLPMLDILKAHFDIKDGDQELVIKGKMEDKILQLDDRLSNHFPSFRELLSIKVEDEKYLQLDPGEKKVRTFEAIRDLLIRGSENRPLVLAVEDLHWIDRTTEEFLDYLIGWLANAPILLILLYRPEYTHQWGSKSYYSKIGVDQLSIRNSAELVQAILEGGDVEPQLRELILGRAGGNPLFVEELTSSLLENGFIERKNHQYLLTRKASEIEVPDTIQGIIAARLDRVEESLKRVMQVASVIGREFAFRILQSTMGMHEELKSTLLNLQGLEFISEKRLFPELEYIFKHALTQEVAYNSLLQKRRKEIHEKIGEAIEFLYPERLEEYYELLAYHYGRTENKDKALKYLELANQKAAMACAMEEAKVYFEEAMKILDSMPETREMHHRRISLLSNQGVVFQMLLRIPEYYDLLARYESVAAKIGDQALLGGFLARLGNCEWTCGDLDKSVQTMSKAVRLCEAVSNHEDAGYTYVFLMWCNLALGDLDRVLAYKEDLLHTLEQRFNSRWYVWGLCAASYAYRLRGQWDKAVKEGFESLRVAEEFSNNSLISFAAWSISIAYSFKGELEKAVEYGELGVGKAPTPADRAWAQSHLSVAWCRTGSLREGVGALAQLDEIYKSTGYMIAALYQSLYLCEGYRLAGEYIKAKQTLKEYMELYERIGMKQYFGWGHRILGEIALKQNPAEAPHHFEKSIDVLGETGAENELALAYAGYGRYYKRQGNIMQAREYLNKALEIFERLGTLIEPEKVRKELAELPND